MGNPATTTIDDLEGLTTIEEVEQPTDTVSRPIINRSHLSIQGSVRIKKLFHYKCLKIVQILCGIYILVLTFTEMGRFGSIGGLRDPESGHIIDPASLERTADGVILINGDLRAIVAQNNVQLILLGITRFSAYLMYPALVLVFVSKLRATMSFLAATPLAMFMHHDLHELHIYCGWVILIDGLLHTIGHLARWIDQGNGGLLFTHYTGISGFVVILCSLLVCLPMIFGKERVKYEVRKCLHYLCYVFAIAMAFHVPFSALPNGGFCVLIFPTLIVWYFLDSLYVYAFMTEKIDTALFRVLPSGCQLSMSVSERFQKRGEQGGFCYVCFPWVDRTQWHAFSLFENPVNPTESTQPRCKFSCSSQGTGQKKSMNLLNVKPSIQFGYKDPLQLHSTMQMLTITKFWWLAVFGITPALSVIRAHKDTRRSNLIWAVRDPYMLEFFLEHAHLDHRGWNLIFYTGKKPLVSPAIDALCSTNVCVIHGRPNLRKVTRNIIYGIESGEGLPEHFVLDQKEEATFMLTEKLKELDRLPQLSNLEKTKLLADYASELGYLFTDLVAHLNMAGDTDTESQSDSDEEEQRFGEHSTRLYADDSMVLNQLRSFSADLDANGRRETLQKSLSCSTQSSFGLRSRRYSGESTRSSELVTSSFRKNANDMMSDCQICALATNQPWEDHPNAEQFIHKMTDETLSTWGILYCGGAKKLEKELEKAAEENNIALHTESFAW